jgi:energy-coupling factor transporter transmembrane protein EcfT
MDSFFILAIIVSTVVFIIIPLLLLGIIFWVLKKKTNKKIAVTIYLILLTAFCYFIITDFYPQESFYLDNFKENTEITLPKSKRLIIYSGNNSIYCFGGYNISYSYKFTSNDYDELYLQLIKRGLQKTEKYLETDENKKLLNCDTSIKIKEILTKDFGFKNFDILFMDDNKTIIFNSNKW